MTKDNSEHLTEVFVSYRRVPCPVITVVLVLENPQYLRNALQAMYSFVLYSIRSSPFFLLK